MAWTKEQWDENARHCMSNLVKHLISASQLVLPPEVHQQAVDLAVRFWSERRKSGEAADLAVKRVLSLHL